MASSVSIRLAAATEFAAVAALRLVAYRAAPQFTTAHEAAVTRWDGPVLVANYAESGLVATIHVIECRTLLELQRASGLLPPSNFPAFPTLILNRGDTQPGRHYQGLNSRLRLAALEIALADGPLTGFVYDGAPRLRLLRELDYAFALVDGGAHPHIARHTAQFSGARAKLLTHSS